MSVLVRRCVVSVLVRRCVVSVLVRPPSLTLGAAKLGPDLPACQLRVVAETDPDCLTIISPMPAN